MKVLHVITGLNDGGAEGVLYRLCKHDTGNEHIVVSMMDEGKYGQLLDRAGIEVCCLNMPQGHIALSSLWELFKLLRSNKPDVVQTWMYHADLIGGVVAKIAGVKSIFWNVRHTNLELGNVKRSTIWIAKICSFISGKLPKKIIYCAHKAKLVHEDLGYNDGKAEIIRNGYDLKQLKHDCDSRFLFRSEIGLSEKDILIGMVGRFDPQKDHINLIKALSIVKKSGHLFKVVLVGKNLDSSNGAFLNYIEESKLTEDVILLGQRTDICAVMSGIDLHVLSSLGEAFPNVLAEAMACGTPCVTTDVGDASVIVGKTGWVVEPRYPEKLAHAIETAMLEKQECPELWNERVKDCRARVLDNFSIEEMVDSYNRVWKHL